MKLLELSARKKKFLIRIGIAVAVVVLLKLTLLAPTKVETVRPVKRDLTAQIYGNGTVEAKVVVPVSCKITGRIVALQADQGDMVKKGQLLARLENGDFAQQVAQSGAVAERGAAQLRLETANLAKANASLELAEKNARRYRNLAEKNLVSKLEAEQYETAHRLASEEVARCRAAMEAAGMEQQSGRAGLGVARSRLGDTVIYAPQDGLIISRDLEQGSVVTPGAAIFRMIDPRVVWVKANVDEASLRGVVLGSSAAISLRSAPDESLPGRVARIGHESDRVTEELEVDVAFDTPRNPLRVGEQADVLIATESRQGVLSIPSAALAINGGKRGVWVADGGRLRFREVRTGIEDRRGFTEVLAGLAVSERVVVMPAEKMQKFADGKKIRAGK